MVSIKVKFRPSGVEGHEGTIYYQIIQDRHVRQVFPGLHIYPSEWDEGLSAVRHTASCERVETLNKVRTAIAADLSRFRRIEMTLSEHAGRCTAEGLIAEYNRYLSDFSLFTFMESLIANLKANGRIRTSETYKSALSSFRTFIESPAAERFISKPARLPIDTLGPEIIEAYQAWLRARGLANNTISFYMRILRAVYNRAVERNLTVDTHPFRHVYTGIDKTVKRAIPLSSIRRIKELELSRQRGLDFARDMFLLSFYLRGISFIDLAHLRKTDLSGGFVRYKRRKTGQRLMVKWTAEMQKIKDKYPEGCGAFLLPIIRHADGKERNSYRNAAYRINRNLKQIAKLAGIDTPLTLYVARHSWASAAKVKGIPLSVICEGMGHDSETTTQIYLASLDTSAVDKANNIILKSLN